VRNKIALVHKQSGDKAKALDFSRQGQAIMARLTKLSPDNAAWKQDLARFDQEIAALAPSRQERRLVQKGGVRGSDWPFARRKNEQNPSFGR
jgi:hypothetical protein